MSLPSSITPISPTALTGYPRLVSEIADPDLPDDGIVRDLLGHCAEAAGTAVLNLTGKLGRDDIVDLAEFNDECFPHEPLIGMSRMEYDTPLRSDRYMWIVEDHRRLALLNATFFGDLSLSFVFDDAHPDVVGVVHKS